MKIKAEYLWLDGTEPSAHVRSKTKILSLEEEVNLSKIPEWGFDGSSTYQADTPSSLFTIFAQILCISSRKIIAQ